MAPQLQLLSEYWLVPTAKAPYNALSAPHLVRGGTTHLPEPTGAAELIGMWLLSAVGAVVGARPTAT